MARRGAPTLYTQELGEEICERITNGETLTKICSDERMPDYRTVMDWIDGETATAKDAGFTTLYARARQLQINRMSLEMLDISDDSAQDQFEKEAEDGGIQRLVNHEHVKRSELRVKTRQWLLSRLNPAQYGDRIAHQQLDEHGKPAKAGITVIVDGAQEE